MSLIVTNQAETMLLRQLTNNEKPEDLVVQLYANNVTVTSSHTEKDLEEVRASGYSSQTLDAEKWEFPKNDTSSALYPQISFTFKEAVGKVYGYYITQKKSGKLLFAEKFPKGPFNIQRNGDQIKITLKLQLSQTD